MAVEKRLYNVADFEEFVSLPENSERRLELVDGVIHERFTTEYIGYLIGTIGAEIKTFVRRKGRTTVRVMHHGKGDEQNALLVDIAYTSPERVQPLVKKGSVPQMPDLAVEVKSPYDSITKMRRKAEIYLQNGARMVWLIYPEQQLVEVYQPEVDIQILQVGNTINGGEVLPGFSMAVSDVFAE